ncbi:hypothetical protein ABK040_005825 [Willaertia magna]
MKYTHFLFICIVVLTISLSTLIFAELTVDSAPSVTQTVAPVNNEIAANRGGNNNDDDDEEFVEINSLSHIPRLFDMFKQLFRTSITNQTLINNPPNNLSKLVNGFEFTLTERTGQKQSYNGVFQVQSVPLRYNDTSKPTFITIDLFSKGVSYHVKITEKTSSVTLQIQASLFCFRVELYPTATNNIELMNKLKLFGSKLLNQNQVVYPISGNNVLKKRGVYDKSVNDICKRLNTVAFAMFDEEIVFCGDENKKYLITRNLIIKLNKIFTQVNKKDYNNSKCIRLQQLDVNLQRVLGDKYFEDLISSLLSQNVTSIQDETFNKKKKFWFGKPSISCELPYMKDDSVCKPYFNVKKILNIPKKVCIFIHGAGGTGNIAPNNQSYPEYWGDIEMWTPQCKERWFLRRKTSDIGWDDLKLQRYYCSMAMEKSGFKNATRNGVPLIKNTVIFTHSQGGLVLSAALKNNICAIDNTTSSWYAISPPFLGSDVVAKLIKYCHAYKHSTRIMSKDYIFGYFATVFGYCEPGTDRPYKGYMSLAPNYCANGVCTADILPQESSARGRMCGTNPIGLLSKFSVPLLILSQATNIPAPNDGMLEFNSCSVRSGGTFTAEYLEPKLYRAIINHADSSCRNGNGWFGSARQPCAFYLNKY